MSPRILVGLAILGAAPFLTGCSTMSNTGKGALAGGAIGAGSGAIISEATGGKAGPGAVIGGLAGALIGGAVGNEQDRREREALQARAAVPPMRVDDVMQWTKEGKSDDLIINEIRTTNSTYQLSTEDVRLLSSNGVSDRVIMEMQNRRPDAYPRGRWVHGPPPPVIYAPARPVYIVHPPPPPPPSFGVGIAVSN